jgi:hypothetical protein
MKFKSQKFLGALVVCGCLAALRTQASFEYDFVPDSPTPGVSGSIFLDAASNPLPDGSQADIVSLNIMFNGVTYTEANLVPNPLSILDWDANTINTMALQLLGAKGILSVLDGGILGGGATREVSGSWNAPSVPDPANTSMLFVIAVGSLGVWHWLRRTRSVTVS